MAQEVNLSPGHLTTTVRRKTGRNVLEWISERRIAQARKLLVQSDLAVGEVGRKVRYDDAGYFVRPFKRSYGVTSLGCRRAGRS